jgi:hypothetical protein
VDGASTETNPLDAGLPPTPIQLFYANADGLKYEYASVLECIEKLDANVAIITETHASKAGLFNNKKVL